jgi:hypothetical protein
VGGLLEALAMTKFGRVLAAALGALSLVAAGSATVLAHEEHRIVQFESMAPVTGAAVGAVNDRGLTGGGLPWVIASGSGEVDRNGHVSVTVMGLVIPAKGNINPITSLKAIVSCVTEHHVIVNVSTGLFPADGAGDSTISDTVALPRHCGHPIVFVANAGNAWFAMSNPRGHDEDDD